MIGLLAQNPLFHAALQTVLASAVLMALVLLVRRPFAMRFGAKAAYMLWLLPAARLVIPPLPSGWSLFGIIAPRATEDTPVTMAMLPNVHVNQDFRGIQLETAPPVPPSNYIIMPATDSDTASWLDTVAPLLPWLVIAAWITGSLVLIALTVRRQSVFHGLIAADSRTATPSIWTQTEALRNDLGLRRQVDVRMSLLCSGPLVTGALRPVILLPEWFEDDYSKQEQRDALLHELMHVHRHDLWALHIANLLVALQWFNPVAHFALRAFRSDQEAACDADILRGNATTPHAYGSTLVKAARMTSRTDRSFASASLTLAHPIKERLTLMQNPTPTFRQRLLGTTIALTLGSAALIATASCVAAAEPLQDQTPALAGGTGNDDHAPVSHTYSWSSHQSENGFQIVLLNDPFAAAQPALDRLGDIEAEFDDSDFDIEFDFEGLEDLEALAELEGLSELENLGSDLAFHFISDGDITIDIQREAVDGGTKIIIPSREIFIPDTAEIEARAEAMAERVEANTKVHVMRMEKMAEANAMRAEKVAERAEAMAARYEEAFGEDFQRAMEGAGNTVEQLVNLCEARDRSITTPEIVSVTNEADGQSYRAVCVNGTKAALKSDTVREFVMSAPSLTDEEKARFNEKREMRIDIRQD